ncbi:MAG: ribokinase [Methanobrevibacter sp.]|nr:ribokinase [Methanobrevibacter sp.]
MTIVVIGPITQDLIIRGDERKFKIGGASFFQSFVFEKYYPDYITIINCKESDLINEFPNPKKVKVLKKDNTHYFINNYLNSDVRLQSSNFANIPITVNDLDNILSEINVIDAFILNPLNGFDFPIKTIDYLKSFDIPVFLSIQGFLRYPLEKVNEDYYSVGLKSTKDLIYKISDIEGLFLDENEASLLSENHDFNIKEIVITNGSKGSRVIADREYKVNSVKCDNIVDSTGCGDTFMAAYISKKLKNESVINSANFASKIASEKLKYSGPFRK